MWVIDFHGSKKEQFIPTVILVLFIHLFDNIWYIYLTAKAFVTLQLDKPCSLDCKCANDCPLKSRVTDRLCSFEEKWESLLNLECKEESLHQSRMRRW